MMLSRTRERMPWSFSYCNMKSYQNRAHKLSDYEGMPSVCAAAGLGLGWPLAR